MYRSIDDHDSGAPIQLVVDILKYRIPTKEIVSSRGAFRPLDENEVTNGFIVTDFLLDQIFIFDDTITSTDRIQKKVTTLPYVIDQSDYLLDAAKMVDSLKNNGGKAILSRIKRVQIVESADTIFKSLCEAYPKAFVYFFESEVLGTWVGASPEILLTRDGDQVKTMALAGTRKSDETHDWTQKEYEEHAFVADFIEKTTTEFGVKNIDRNEIETVQSGPVKHLLTKFAFDLPKGEEWNWIRAIHPTPAVSGWPRKTSLELIAHLESHNRFLYTGVIGVIHFETSLYVNLRCAQIIENEMFLYLGGGFTKDSVPVDEWQETENKAKTILNVLKKE